MSIEILSGLVAIAVAFIVVAALGFGLVLIRDGKLVRGASVLLATLAIIISAMLLLYH